MINSHLLYRLSYRGTTARMLLIKKEKSTLYGRLIDQEVGAVQLYASRSGDDLPPCIGADNLFNSFCISS